MIRITLLYKIKLSFKMNTQSRPCSAFSPHRCITYISQTFNLASNSRDSNCNCRQQVSRLDTTFIWMTWSTISDEFALWESHVKFTNTGINKQQMVLEWNYIVLLREISSQPSKKLLRCGLYGFHDGIYNIILD